MPGGSLGVTIGGSTGSGTGMSIGRVAGSGGIGWVAMGSSSPGTNVEPGGQGPIVSAGKACFGGWGPENVKARAVSNPGLCVTMLVSPLVADARSRILFPLR
jgi:hypothetical protein